MKDYLYKYFDKRYPIVDGVAQLKDNNPIQRVRYLFDVRGDELFVSWLESRMGDTYSIRFLSDSQQKWFKKGELHREDGPAKVVSETHKEWWLDGRQYHESDHKIKMAECLDGK